MGKDKGNVAVAEQVDEATIKAEEQKAEERKALYEKKKSARVRIAQFLAENAEQLGSLKDDIELFLGRAGTRRSRGTGVASLNFQIRKAFLDAMPDGLSEMDIFKQFHIGRPEMLNKIRLMILTPNPEDKVWVTFDDATETYNVVGTGKDAPTGWTGYLPAEMRQL